MERIVDFVLAVEPFKLLPLEKAPRAEKNTALLLYRERLGVDAGIVIFPEQMVLSSSIRMGKYDRKIVVDISKKQFQMDGKIKTQEQYCDFLIHVELEYSVSDVKYVAKNDLADISGRIQESVKQFMNLQQEQYSMDDEIALARKLDELSMTLTKEYVFLYINARTNIRLDEAGQKVQESNIKTITGSIITENELELEKLNLQKEEEIERTNYQEKRKTLEEKNKLDEAKLDKIQGLQNRYGEDALLVNGFLDGEFDNSELNERIRQQQQENRANRMAELKELSKMNILTEPFVDDYVRQMFLTTPVESVAVEEKAKEMLEQKDEVVIEDGDEIGNYVDNGE